MKEGWIFLMRKFEKWELYTDSYAKSLFIHCLLKANYTDRKGSKGVVKRGSFLTSFPILADATGMNLSTIRRKISLLENAKCLVVKSSNKGTHVTICNYDDYQDSETNRNNKRTDSGNNKRTDSGNNKRTVKRNPIKEYKEYKEDICQLSPKADVCSPENLSPHEVTKSDGKFFKEVCEVVEYLNLKINKKRKPESASSKHIRGRMNEGYEVSDLKMVIDLKFEEWKDNQKMKKFLRVDTLFNSENFEKYIDEVMDSGIGKASSSGLSKGDKFSKELFSGFGDDDVVIVNFKSNNEDMAASRENSRMLIKSIKAGIRLNRGEYIFVETVD